MRRRVSAGDLVDPLGDLILGRRDAQAELILERAGKGAPYGVGLPVGDLNDLLDGRSHGAFERPDHRGLLAAIAGACRLRLGACSGLDCGHGCLNRRIDDVAGINLSFAGVGGANLVRQVLARAGVTFESGPGRTNCPFTPHTAGADRSHCSPGATAAHPPASLFWCAGSEFAAQGCGGGAGCADATGHG